MKDNTTSVRFCDIESVYDVDYADDNIVFRKNLSDLPIDQGMLRIDMYLLAACTQGKMSVEINGKNYLAEACDVIVCPPDSVIINCMTSLDFEGVVLCLSKNAIRDCFPENELLEKMLFLIDKPIVHVSDESVEMLRQLGFVLDAKIKSSNMQYKKPVILSLVKGGIYEILSNLTAPQTTVHHKSPSADGIFKSFIHLLSTTKVKPRTVAWYASQLCITPKYLSTVCKAKSGKTAFVWINEFVVKDIVYWLKNSNMTVKEIAHYLHFPNISFFGKFCRIHLGMSPTEYRKHM